MCSKAKSYKDFIDRHNKIILCLAQRPVRVASSVPVAVPIPPAAPVEHNLSVCGPMNLPLDERPSYCEIHVGPAVVCIECVPGLLVCPNHLVNVVANPRCA